MEAERSPARSLAWVTTTSSQSDQQHQTPDPFPALLLFKSIEYEANGIKSLIRSQRTNNDCHLVASGGGSQIAEIEARRSSATALLDLCKSAASSRVQGMAVDQEMEKPLSTIIDVPALGLSQAQMRLGRSTRSLMYIPPVQPDLPFQMSQEEIMHNVNRFRETLDSFIEETINVLQPQHVRSYKSMECTPYEVDDASEIGHGAFGKVQRVIHRQTGKAFAMKTFEVVLSVSAKKSILQEILILKYCHHPNIVRLIEAFSLESTSKMAIVIEPWAPYTLWKFLINTDAERDKACPWFDPASPRSTQVVLRIMHGIVLAIVHFHHRSVKHKDLKPENILLFEPGTADIAPLITDVGVSKLSFHGAPTNFTKSTYQFLAPEQIRHEESTLKADVWQLGCCFALLLAVAHGGASAFRQLWGVIDSDTSSCQVAHEHPRFMEIFKSVYRRGGAKESVFKLITGMLHVDPSERLTIIQVEAMVQALMSS